MKVGRSERAEMRLPVRATLSAASVLFALLTAACSADPPSMGCGVAGREHSCSCPSHGVGIQTCMLDGSWGRCMCFYIAAGTGGQASGSGGGHASGGAELQANSGVGGNGGFGADAGRAAGRGGMAGRPGLGIGGFPALPGRGGASGRGP